MDAPEAQKAFVEQEGLTFPLLSDSDRKAADLYGVSRGSVARRVSFVIDERGIIRHVDADVRVSKHGKDLLERIREMRR